MMAGLIQLGGHDGTLKVMGRVDDLVLGGLKSDQRLAQSSEGSEVVNSTMTGAPTHVLARALSAASSGTPGGLSSSRIGRRKLNKTNGTTPAHATSINMPKACALWCAESKYCYTAPGIRGIFKNPPRY